MTSKSARRSAMKQQPYQDPPGDEGYFAAASHHQPTTFATPQETSADRKHDNANERAPLLGSSDRNGGSSGSPGAEASNTDDGQSTRSIWYLIALTISIGGLQIAWTVELSNGSPYLMSLGISKSVMALVWIAGPLTGTLVQPYVGMLSDTCRLPWGKRKPFMVGGAAATVASLLFLAWTREIVTNFLGLFGADPASHGVKMAVMITAVIGIYVLDFAINTVQAAIRAFIVDCAPAHQQEAANAMASRITGFGNIIGYAAGNLNLPKYLPFLGDTQFKILCVIASIALASTVAFATSVIRERDPRLDGPPPENKPSAFTFFFTIFKSIKRLPPQIKRVCEVQFCAWIGFFPLLFYTSSYIGEIFIEPYLEANPHMTEEELAPLYDEATRVGTFALLINSVVSLLTNVFLPFFIAPTYDSHPVIPGESVASPEFEEADKPSILDHLRIPGFTLKRAWFGALILFSVCMFCTVIVRTITAATVLIGLVGVTWAMTLWAPWAIISAEISRRDATRRAQKARSPDPVDGIVTEEEEEDQAGVILGIHNMAIAAPQIIATVASSIIFKFLQKPRGTPGDRSFSVVLALGGIFVLIASYFVLKIEDESTAPAQPVADEEQALVQERDDAEPVTPRPPRLHKRMSSFQVAKRASVTRNKSYGGAEMY